MVGWEGGQLFYQKTGLLCTLKQPEREEAVRGKCQGFCHDPQVDVNLGSTSQVSKLRDFAYVA